MKVTQDEVVDRQAVLNIEVDAESLEEHLKRAYQRLVGRVAVPGFRKGKAPRRIFENAYGRARFLDEALETLVPDIVGKAIRDRELAPADAPRVAIVEREPLPKIRATVPLEPTVELGDYKALRVDVAPAVVSEEDVDRRLEALRDAQAAWVPVERPVRNGDMAVIERARAVAGGKEIMAQENFEFLALEDSAYPLPGFAGELIGMTAGESKEFALLIPDDYPNEDLAGETAVFTVALSAVKEKVLPAVDDELARGVGEGFETLAELRAALREDLESEAAEHRRRELREKAVQALVEGGKVEIAPLIVEHEAEHVLEEQQRRLAAYRMSLDDYMARAGRSGEQLAEEARAEARARLARQLLIHRLAEAEGIEVADEEIRAEIDAMKADASTPADRARYESDGVRNAVEGMLLRRKAIDRLAEIAAEGAPEDEGPAADQREAAPEDEGPEPSAQG